LAPELNTSPAPSNTSTLSPSIRTRRVSLSLSLSAYQLENFSDNSIRAKIMGEYTTRIHGGKWREKERARVARLVGGN